MTVVLAVVGVVLAATLVVIYNGLVRLRVLGDNAWADIDVQLKRRHDLVPNVVEAVKGYMGYERGTLERVVQARSQAMAASGPAARGDAEGGLTQALRGLFALVESYPQLRASEHVTELQRTLVEIEDAIQSARRYYNAVVRDFNTRVQQFPSNLAAMLFGFAPREFFQIAESDERSVPEVRLPSGGEGR